MMQFPGAIYRPDGRAIDRRTSDLTVARLISCEHRWIMRHRPGASIVQVWLLNADAIVEDVPWMTWQTAMGRVWDGEAILLISRRFEPILSLREMALAVMAINKTVVREAAEANEAGA